jgi:hypothetical protein
MNSASTSCGHEHGGRLVEDQDLGTSIEHLEDLDALLVADAEIADQGVGIDVQAVSLAEFADPAASLVGVQRQLRAGLLAEHDVLPHGEVRREHERLEHHADAVGDRILG